MPPPTKNNRTAILTVIIWVILAAVCIQGYLLISKKPGPVRPPGQYPVKTVTPDKKKQTFVFRLPEFGKKPPPAVKKTPPPPPVTVTGQITLVIDDWGYNRTHCKFLAELPVPAGIAILPHLPFSQDVIQCAIENQKDPMLHLPLEPHNMREAYETDYLLTTAMPPSAVKKMLAKILSEMPGIAGVNNHTGSKGTEDDALMTMILAEIKRRGLFFVDSVTSDRSVCGPVAQKLKMRIARRDVFLDNRNERTSIEHEFADAARIAKRRGHVLVIGHDRALTLQIIKEQVKKLQLQGYEFISVPEYIKKYEYPRN